MRLRTVIILGLGALAVRKAVQVRRRQVLLLEPGPKPLRHDLDGVAARSVPAEADLPEPAEALSVVPGGEWEQSPETTVVPSAPHDLWAGLARAEPEHAAEPADAEHAETLSGGGGWPLPEGVDALEEPPPVPSPAPALAAEPEWPAAGESGPAEVVSVPVAEPEAGVESTRAAVAEPGAEQRPADPVPVALPAVEDVPSGWSVVLHPGEEGAAERTAVIAVPAVSPEPAAPTPTSAPAAPPPVAGDDVRRLLLANEVPLVYMGATPLPMLGLDRMVGRLSAISAHDCFDGRHGGVFVPRTLQLKPYASPVEVANALLAEPDVVDRLRLRPGRIVLLAADEESERLAGGFGHTVALASATMRRRLGAPSELVRLARDAGVRALPAVSGHAASYQDLLLLARGLGTDLLVESLDRPGWAPVAIASPEDWAANERTLGSDHLRVTRRLDGRRLTLLGVATAHGTIVGPSVVAVHRFPDVPPFAGGAAICDVAGDLEQPFGDELRSMTAAVGDRLAREGFAGVFEVDLAVDRRSDEPTLTAVRPEASAALALDTVAAVAADELPLLALHLATQLGADLAGEAESLWARWSGAPRDPWALLLVEHGSGLVETVTEAPASGIWQLDPSGHGGIRYVRSESDWRSIWSADEAFYLRLAKAGTVRYPGAALGVVVAPGRLVDDHGKPGERALLWMRGVRKNVWTAPAPDADPIGPPAGGAIVV